MLKKSIIAILICICVIGFSVIGSYADEITLVQNNFDEETLDEAPGSVYALGTVAPSKSDVVIKEKEGQICADILQGKYMGLLFENEITDGIFVIEFDTWQSACGPLYCCLYNTDAYTISVNSPYCMRYLFFGTSVNVQAYKASGYSSSDLFVLTDERGNNLTYGAKKWNHCKAVVNMDSGTIQYTINGLTSKEYPVSYLDDAIGGINFYNGGGAGAERFIDNIKVYIPDNTPELSFIDYNGNDHTPGGKIVPTLEKAELKFPYPLSGSISNDDLKLINFTDSTPEQANIIYDISDDRRTVSMKFADGVLKGNEHYTISIPGDVFNHGDDISFEFDTSELTDVFQVVGMGVEDMSGNEYDMPLCEDEGNLWIEFVKNGNVTPPGAVLALTEEADGVLVGVQVFDVKFEGNGKTKLVFPVKFTSREFDMAGIYLWNAKDFVPIKESVIKEAK